MTNKEIMEKTKLAEAIGTPVFLTALELYWLSNHLLEFSEPYQTKAGNQLRAQEKIDLSYAATIGLKCAQET